jgi:hypothetical protein
MIERFFLKLPQDAPIKVTDGHETGDHRGVADPVCRDSRTPKTQRHL